MHIAHFTVGPFRYFGAIARDKAERIVLEQPKGMCTEPVCPVQFVNFCDMLGL